MAQATAEGIAPLRPTVLSLLLYPRVCTDRLQPSTVYTPQAITLEAGPLGDRPPDLGARAEGSMGNAGSLGLRAENTHSFTQFYAWPYCHQKTAVALCLRELPLWCSPLSADRPGLDSRPQCERRRALGAQNSR